MINKPTTPSYSNALGFGATSRAIVPFCETAGLPVEAQNLTLGRPWDGMAGYGTGPCPTINPNGFPYTPTPSPTLKLPYGCPTIVWPGAGWPSASLPAQRTYAVIFKSNYTFPNLSATPILNLLGTGASTATNPCNGVYLQASASGLNAGCFRSFGNQGGNALTTYMVQGRWYALALSITTGATTRQWQVYDFAAGANLGAVTTQNDATAMTEPTVSDLQLCPQAAQGNEFYPFVGEIACILLDGQAWTTTQFANFVADPWATVRGTYTASGALTPGQGALQHAENGVVAVSFSGFTGIGAGGTGSPAAYLQRTTDLSLAPNAANRIAALAANASGNYSYVDTSASLGTIYGYRLEGVDGTGTAYSPPAANVPILGRPRAGANLGILNIGDSRTEGFQAPLAMAREILEKGDRKVSWLNHGKAGTRSDDWSGGTVAQVQISINGGTPTSGTFYASITLSGGTAQTFSGIPYNCTAAQLETTLEANPSSTTAGIGGAGNAICTGGPLPGTPITVTFSGPVSSNKAASITPGNTSLNNGASAVAATIQAGSVLSTTYLVPAIAAALANGATVAHYQIGTNDMNNAAGTTTPTNTPANFARFVTSTANYALAQGLAQVYLSAAPLIRLTLANNATANYASSPAQVQAGNLYDAQLAAIANGSTIIHLPPRCQANVVNNILETADGYHGLPPEALAEGRYWGKGILDTLSPAACGGVSKSRILGGV